MCLRAEDMRYLVRIMTHIRVDMHTQNLKRIRWIIEVSVCVCVCVCVLLLATGEWHSRPPASEGRALAEYLGLLPKL
jgi:TRAP-type C4-dicarboxylate transport system permease small subunit